MNKLQLSLVLIFGLVLCFSTHSVGASTCSFVSSDSCSYVVFDQTVSDQVGCWNCAPALANNTAPGPNDDITIDGASFILGTGSVSYKSVTIKNVAGGLYVMSENVGISFSSLSCTDVPISAEKGIAFTGKASGSQMSLNGCTMDLKTSTFTNAKVTASSTSDIKVDGKLTLTNSDFTMNGNKLDFFSTGSEYEVNLNGQSNIISSGIVTIAAPTEITSFELNGAQTNFLQIKGNGELIVGQSSSPKWCEYDIDTTVLLLDQSNITISAMSMVMPKWFSAAKTTRMTIDGELRFDHNIQAGFGSQIIDKENKGTITAYESAHVFISDNVYLPKLEFEIAGGTVGVAVTDVSKTNVNLEFAAFAIVSGGSFGDHFTDLTRFFTNINVTAATISITDAVIDMNKDYTLTLNSQLGVIDKFSMTNGTTIIFNNGNYYFTNGGVTGHVETALVFETGAKTVFQTPGVKWTDVEKVVVKSAVEFDIWDEHDIGDNYIEAKSADIVLDNVDVTLRAEFPPLEFGELALIKGKSASGNVRSTTSTGDYACLNGNAYVKNTALVVPITGPTIPVPTGLSADHDAEDDTVRLRWAAPSTLSCYMAVDKFIVKIGDDTYTSEQRQLHIAEDHFAECTFYHAQVKMVAKTTFAPFLQAESAFSAVDNFIVIPPPKSVEHIATSYETKTLGNAEVTFKFLDNPVTMCGCSSYLTKSYYRIRSLFGTTNTTNNTAVLSEMPEDHTVDFAIDTVCVYAGVDTVVPVQTFMSKIYSTRLTFPSVATPAPTSAPTPAPPTTPAPTSAPSKIEGSDDKSIKDYISGGVIAGIVLGVIVALLLGGLVGFFFGRNEGRKLPSRLSANL